MEEKTPCLMLVGGSAEDPDASLLSLPTVDVAVLMLRTGAVTVTTRFESGAVPCTTTREPARTAVAATPGVTSQWLLHGWKRL
jgi:hypothetical protein